MKRATRFAAGSVVYDKRRRSWHFYYYDAAGKRRSKLIGTKSELPNKSAARRAATVQQPAPEVTTVQVQVPIVSELVTAYLDEKAPKRKDTRRSYGVWLRCHILPRWGDRPITDLQPRPVEMWIDSLMRLKDKRPLTPKSKAHIRGLLSRIWDYSMWRGNVPTQRNPMSLVDIRGSSKRTKTPRTLTVPEALLFLRHLQRPFHEMALLCLLLGLRISECLGLKWSDVNWLSQRLTIDRSIVNQNVDDVKTDGSRRSMPLDRCLVEVLRSWKQASQFAGEGDYMFASPHQIGRLPWSYDQVWRQYQKAAQAAGIGRLGTHSLRHTYRSMLDAEGTPLAVQQKLMRHSDVRTVMSYGDIITDEESQALTRIARLVFPKQHADSTQ